MAPARGGATEFRDLLIDIFWRTGLLRGNVLLATLAAKSLTVAEIGDRSPTFRRISHTASYLPVRPGHPLCSSWSWCCHRSAHIHHVEPTGRRLQVCRADRRGLRGSRHYGTLIMRIERADGTRITRIKPGGTGRGSRGSNADQTRTGRGSTRIKASSGRDADLTDEDVRTGRRSRKPALSRFPSFPA